jgi:hypothetical protein
VIDQAPYSRNVVRASFPNPAASIRGFPGRTTILLRCLALLCPSIQFRSGRCSWVAAALSFGFFFLEFGFAFVAAFVAGDCCDDTYGCADGGSACGDSGRSAGADVNAGDLDGGAARCVGGAGAADAAASTAALPRRRRSAGYPPA